MGLRAAVTYEGSCMRALPRLADKKAGSDIIQLLRFYSAGPWQQEAQNLRCKFVDGREGIGIIVCASSCVLYTVIRNALSDSPEDASLGQHLWPPVVELRDSISQCLSIVPQIYCIRSSMCTGKFRSYLLPPGAVGGRYGSGCFHLTSNSSACWRSTCTRSAKFLLFSCMYFQLCNTVPCVPFAVSARRPRGWLRTTSGCTSPGRARCIGGRPSRGRASMSGGKGGYECY